MKIFFRAKLSRMLRQRKKEIDVDEKQELAILTGIQTRLQNMATEAQALEAEARQFVELQRVADYVFNVRHDLKGALSHMADTLMRGPGRPMVPRGGDGRPITTKIEPPGRFSR
jgi:hypothetical protein